MALAGGKTPTPLYSLLSSPAITEKIPWERIHFFHGDERFVAHNHPDSNFAMIAENLFSRIPSPKVNIYPVQTSLPTPKDAAQAYETTIRQTFKHLTPKLVDPDRLPCFDLILLGLGADGHTASLFSGSSAISEHHRLVNAVYPPHGITPFVARITFTLSVINNAKTVVFLVADPYKAGIVDEILNSPQPTALPYPAAHVRAKEVVWFYVGKQ